VKNVHKGGKGEITWARTLPSVPRLAKSTKGPSNKKEGVLLTEKGGDRKNRIMLSKWGSSNA